MDDQNQNPNPQQPVGDQGGQQPASPEPSQGGPGWTPPPVQEPVVVPPAAPAVPPVQPIPEPGQQVPGTDTDQGTGTGV